MGQRRGRAVYEGLDHDSEVEYEGTSRAKEVRECFEEIMRGLGRVRDAGWVKEDGEDIGDIAAESKKK